MNNILLKRAVSKKGSVLFCVLCVMTFVIMLAGIALGVTSAAHQGVIFEEKEQQSYYTAKSAVDAVVSYLNTNGTSGDLTSLSGQVGELKSENYDLVGATNAWPKDMTQRRTNWETAAGVDSYIKGKWSSDYKGMGKYCVDVYPTAATGLYKIIAESEYDGHKSSVAAIIQPGKSQAMFEDAIVGLGGAGISGSSRVAGGIALNMTSGFDGKNSPYGGSDIYLGGNITNTGDIRLNENGHAVKQEYFTSVEMAQTNLMISARGNLSVGATLIEDTSQVVWPYYSYLVSEGDFSFKKWEDKDKYSFASKITDDSINHKGVLVGGNFVQNDGATGVTFSSVVYVKGNMNFSKGGNIIFEQPVYVLGNVNLQNGTFEFKNGLYVKGNANISVDKFYGNLYSNNINFHSNGGTNTQAAYSETSIQSEINECEKTFQSKLELCERVNDYSDWTFTTEQSQKMGIGVVNASAYNKYSLSVEGGTPKLITSGKTNSTQNGYALTISDSGVFDKLTLESSTNGGTTLTFDTRNGAGYKNLYIRLTLENNPTAKKITNNDANKMTFKVIGKGNVFLYLDDGVRWTSNATPIKGDDYTAPDGSLQPHLFMISNTISSSYHDVIIDVGSANGTGSPGDDVFSFYIYAPNAAIKQSGSSGFRGAVIAKYVDECGGSNCAAVFIKPASGNTDEANDGLPSSDNTTAGFSVKSWYKY